MNSPIPHRWLQRLRDTLQKIGWRMYVPTGAQRASSYMEGAIIGTSAFVLTVKELLEGPTDVDTSEPPAPAGD